MKNRWTLGRRLLLSFLVVAAITLALGVVGYQAVRADQQAIHEIGSVHLTGVDTLHGLREAAAGIKVAQRTLLVPALDAKTRERQYENVQRIREEYQSDWKTYEALPKSPEEAALWARLMSAWTAWRGENDKYFELCHAADKTGIANPAKLVGDLARFRGDHYRLRTAVLEMLHSGKVIEGGDDAAQCGFGKWQAAYRTEREELQKSLDATAPAHQRVHAACAQIKALVRDGKLDEASAAYFAEMAPAADEFLKNFDGIVQQGNDALALVDAAQQQSLGKCRDTELAVNELVDQIVVSGRNAATQTVAATQRRSAVVNTAVLATTISAVVAAMGLGLWMTRSLSRLLIRISTQLHDGAREVNAAAAQVAAAAQQLAEGASEQASSLEESSSALEQMAAMTRTNAGNAKEASGLAEQTRSAAGQGDQTAQRLSAAMTAINESSQKISKVIKAIEEIAFQTNLLALNAAVEAARAGEHGKGFAVVAEEVRNLAQRAAQATRETTTLIEDSVSRAREGSGVATEVGQALTAIFGNAAKTTELIDGISRSSQEQAQGVDQINTAVSQMDRVTQQNAAGAEESASAAEELSAQAQTIQGMVAELVLLVQGHSDVSKSPGKSAAQRTATPAHGLARGTTHPSLEASASLAPVSTAAPHDAPASMEF